MMDLAMVVLLAVGFYLIIGFTHWCNHVESGGDPE